MTTLTQPQDELLHRRLGRPRGRRTRAAQQVAEDLQPRLQQVPQTLMETEEGLQDVLDYLCEEVRADRLLGARR